MNPLIKIGEAFNISAENLQSTDSVLLNPEINNNFKRFAAGLKSIAPKAKDFLYFTAIMMHAAEAALLDESGKIKKDANGKEVTAHWEKLANGGVKWICSDASIKPYFNQNRDAFPEYVLIQAHKKWVGKPLCLDHQSDSVDKIRGLIVDTYYDSPNKRVIALCALDKINYPDLARKVSTGYAASVSMGTAVGKAICSDCGNVARVEAEFCDCMRTKRCCCEINEDLNPLELSLVVNGADHKAKIKTIIAKDLRDSANSLQNYLDSKEQEFSTKPNAFAAIKEDLISLTNKLSSLENNNTHQNESIDLNSLSALNQTLLTIKADINQLKESHMADKKAYFQGAGGVNEPTPKQVKYPNEVNADQIRLTQDKQMVGQMDTGPVDGMHPGYDSFGESEEARKKRLQRLAAEQEERKLRREAAMKVAEEERKKAMDKQGYWQGGGDVNEPTPGKPKYPIDPSNTNLRLKSDKQMVGAPPFPNVGDVEGLYGDDEALKKKLLRASLKAKKFMDYNLDGSLNPKTSGWVIKAKFEDSDQENIILKASVEEIAKGKSENYTNVITDSYGKKLMTSIRTEGLSKIAGKIKSAQMAPMSGGTETMGMDPLAMGAPTGGAPEIPAPEMGGEKPTDPTAQIDTALSEIDRASGDMKSAVEALKSETAGQGSVGEELPPGGAEMLPGATAKLVDFQRKLSKALLIGCKEVLASLKEESDNLRASKQIYSRGINHLSPKDQKDYTKATKESLKFAKQHLSDSNNLIGAFVQYTKGTEHLIRRANKEIAIMKRAQPDFAGHTDPHDPLNPTLPTSQVKPLVAPVPTKPTKPLQTTLKPLAPPTKPTTPGKISPEEMAQLHAARPGRNLPGGIDEALREGASPRLAPSRSGTTQMLGKPSNLSTSYDVNKADDQHDEDLKEVMKDVKELKEMEKEEHNDVNDVKIKMQPDGSVDVPKENLKDLTASFDMSTIEGRNQFRAKMAEKAEKMGTGEGVNGALMDLVNQSHPGGGYSFKFEPKPSMDLGKIERIDEIHTQMMDFAENQNIPTATKKKAEMIQKLIKAGDLTIDQLISFEKKGQIDSEAVKYWKAFYGQIKDGGSQFAADLLKDYSGPKKSAEDMTVYKAKYARAYTLAGEMAKRDLIEENETSLQKKAEEIMNYSDEAFESTKKLVHKSSIKTASLHLPNNGLLGSGANPMISTASVESNDLQSVFADYWRNKKL